MVPLLACLKDRTHTWGNDPLPLALRDKTLWLPNTEMTKLCVVSDETSTNLFPHFQRLTLQGVTLQLSILGSGGRVQSPRVRLGVDLGGRGRGRRWGVFPRNYIYIVREIRAGSPSDETPWLPNTDMTKPCEVSDETSTVPFPALSAPV